MVLVNADVKFKSRLKTVFRFMKTDDWPSLKESRSALLYAYHLESQYSLHLHLLTKICNSPWH